MGIYRFLLAITVALSHVDVRFLGGHNPGVVAVISFFLISGFVMTGLVRSYYPEYRKVPMFYLDRLARILPQYLLFFVLTAAAYFLFDISSPYLSTVSWAGMAANLLVIPLNFFMYSQTIAGCAFIPQAWSLGLELTFYLLFPVILISGRRNVWLVLSLLMWFFAAFGVVDSDVWGYRLLPGTLFIFLIGSCIFDNQKPSFRHPAVIMSVLMVCCTLPLLYGLDKMALPYNFEVITGLLLGAAVLFFLSGCERNKWDDWLGNLSYGVFLCHFLVIWVIDLLHIPRDAGGYALMLAASILLAQFGYVLIEHPVLQWRHNIRQRSSR